MSALLYRDFPLRSPSAWIGIAAFVKANAQAIWDKGRFLRVIVTEEDRKRTSEANRYYWGVVISTIAECAWLNGRQYSKDVWHEFLAQRFLPKEEMILPDGEIIQRRRSTSELSVSEMADYTEQCRMYAAMELCVEFDGL